MIKEENFPNAYKEVFVILQYMDKEDTNKIPKEFIDMLKEKMNKDYIFNYDESKKIEDQKILKETRTVLAYIFINYWGTKKQKTKIKAKFIQDIIDDYNNV